MAVTEVWERHGVVKADKPGQADYEALTIDERAECIRLRAFDGQNARVVFLSPSEARHAASKLYRLARRISERLGA